MKTSFDEIKRMSFRALDAGRAPAGVDEDSAINTAWLEASGLPGLRWLGDALDTSDPKERHGALEPRLEGMNASVDAGGASAVFLGPGLIDLMAYLCDEHGDDAVLAVERVAHAGFLTGFIGQAREAGHKFVMSPADPAFAASDVLISCKQPPEVPDWEQLRANRKTSLEEGVEADEADFKRVYIYSRKILVPETEQSRLSGAGAGLTDND
ncbi:MAG: DUF3726 domain-containing protein [Alphaproteobacteria bacterium]|nr:DUF3726 domain-containing protein [Alphaproteobacteria bacterium]